MRKLYLPLLTALLMLTTGAASAQAYNSITTNPLNYTFDNPLFWQGGVTPPSPCVACTISINSNVVIAAAAGSLILNNSHVQLYNNAVVQVNTYIQAINNTVFDIGNNATGTEKVILNDQLGLESGSTIQLANPGNFINANNSTSQPQHGPYDDYGNPGFMIAGIYATLVPPINTYTYSEVLTKTGLGTPGTGFYGGQYSFNCGSGFPSTCKAGFVYGPVIIGDAANDGVPDAGILFIQSTTLPVDLVQFLASKNADGSVKVLWATAQEANAATYEVQRSSDKSTFIKIGEVAAKGNSSVTTNYTYTDHSPLPGSSFYRLKMTDLDGRYKYSPIALISSEAANTPLVIYSNPFVDQIRFKVNVVKTQTLTITVSDVLGRSYIRQNYNASAGDNLFNLTPANAAPGMYVLKIHGTGYDQTVKLIKQ